ncbi:transcriptional regulator [Pyrodictium abyssi]|uniref:Putative HTH-type transcriptional regulatory protein PABY_03280 n=1 Tax=Pyrodictium abyssi TaxID=54256 RepID=A0ABM8IT63_9CREN|nr:hypothetical protein PABY_03280 [Pyrodictium abyssi]
MKSVEDVLWETIRTLQMYGYSVDKVVYPEDPRKRSIDVVASRNGESPLLVKIVEDTAQLQSRELRELRECSLLLDAAGLVVANKDGGVEIDYMVAHERSGVYVVSAAGLEAALNNSIYVVKRQGNYYMRVDGEKLREERMRKGYSLGDLAAMLSVSRRSVYMYEQEEVDISLNTALRLMDIFGEDVFKPIPILHEKLEQKRVPRLPRRRVGNESSEAGKAIETIVRAGGEAVETKRIPPDVVARLGDDKMLIVIERRRERRLEKRVYEAAKVAMKVVAKVIAITQRREYRAELEDYGVNIYTSFEEFVSEVGVEEAKKMHNSNSS